MVSRVVSGGFGFSLSPNGKGFEGHSPWRDEVSEEAQYVAEIWDLILQRGVFIFVVPNSKTKAWLIKTVSELKP